MNRSPVTVLGVLCMVLMFGALVSPAAAQGINGVDVACTNGSHILNGVEVVVNMRPGYTYTATALGIGGFDPVLAVLDANGNGLCEDDVYAAASYSAQLPTTGFVAASSLNSQISFSPDALGFNDVSLVVGGYNGRGGEFVLILEGMAVTANDGSGPLAGDPFLVHITPNMLNSGVDVNAYMISMDTELDPYITLVDGNNTPVMACDDAGTGSCNGSSTALDGYYVSTYQGQIGGYGLDAMLSYDLFGQQISANATQNYLGFLMSSYLQSTLGQYVVAFHLGTAT